MTSTAFLIARGAVSKHGVSSSRRTMMTSAAAAAAATKLKEPVRVSITGAAGAIGYALCFRVAAGHLLGADQPVILNLIELPFALDALKGVCMELDDCAFPLLRGVVQTDDIEKGFAGANYALLVGSKPRGKGMERADLLKDNGKIFTGQGKALNKFANKDVKVIVVGNPANTNALIAASNAPDIPRVNFTAMTRLDHNRAVAQVAQKLGAATASVEKLCIWGNHSATQYPDLSHCIVNGKPAKAQINDDAWIRNAFIPDVQQRGAAIIKARGASSAASAANGCLNHVHDWALGTNGKWTSMAVPSDGSYGVPAGVMFSYPVTCQGGKYTIVQGLKIDAFSQQMIDKTQKELFEERDAVAGML